VQVSNPDKVIFGDAGWTKADLVGHYELVACRLLDFAAGRPLTLQRYPNGIGGKGFMQKNASEHFPDTIARYEVAKQGGGTTLYPVVDREEDIAYLANQGTVTFHMWTSSAARPDKPDWLIIDLDPDDGDVAGARRALTDVAALIDELGLAGFPLATGATGFHLWIPLDGSVAIDEASLVARAIAGLAAVRHPDRLTVEFLKKNRHGRVFVDWLRNRPTSTVVVPFSLRPRQAASAAVPLGWDEVDDATPDAWTLGRLSDRLDVDTNLETRAVPVTAIIEQARAEGVDLDTPFDRFGRR
jgi:bifunctional non-homologous end joining protein LigD